MSTAAPVATKLPHKPRFPWVIFSITLFCLAVILLIIGYDQGLWLFAVLSGYICAFTGLSLVSGRTYLSGVPEWDNDKEMGEFDRQETNSQTLAGFALTGLTLIATIFYNKLPTVENLLAFFSVGLMLEIFAAFAFHFRIRRETKYAGFVLQYSGLLAVILGFGSYFQDNVPGSNLLLAIYVIFVIVFFIATFGELYSYYKGWEWKPKNVR